MSGSGLDDHRVHALGAVGRVGMGGEVPQLLPRGGEDPLASRLDDGLIEDPEAHAAGELADHRMAQLRRHDEAVEGLVELVAQGLGQCLGLLQPAVEERHHDRNLRWRALVGEEDPVDRLLELGRALEPVHAVMGQRAREPCDERLGQAFALDVERVQVGPEVLTGAADPFAVVLVEVLALRRRPVAGELGQVGEDREDLELAAQQLGIVGGQLVPGLLEVADQPTGRLHAHVEAHDQAAQGVEMPARAKPRPGLRRCRRRAEPDPRGIGRRHVSDGLRLDDQERRPGVDVGAGGGEDLPDPPAVRGHHRHLHLHRLEDRDRRPGLHLVARGDGDGHDERRRGGSHDASPVSRHAMGDSVDLDHPIRAVGDRVDRERVLADHQPAREAAEGLGLHGDGRAIGLDPVAARTRLRDGETIALAPVAEIDRPADLVARPWPAPRGSRIEAAALELLLGVVDVDGGGEQRDAGVTRRDVAVGGDDAVEPTGAGRAGDHLRAVEQVEQEALVRRPRAHHHGRLRQGPAQPRARLGAIPAPADDLGDTVASYVRGDDVAHGNARLDAHPRPGGQREQLDRPGRGGEATLGVLGVEPGLDRVAERGRRLALQVPARGDVDLQLHEVEPRRHLGDGVLGLQARGEPGEREGALVGAIEELDGPGAAVADRPGQVDGRRPQLAFLLGAEHRRARLLDQLPAAAPDRALPSTGGPDGAVRVGEDLHADAMRARNAGVLRRRPGVDPQARLLGEPLHAGLVAEAPDDVGRRTDEDDADASAQLGEGGILGDEAPSHPGRVGAARPERPLELAVVEVGARPADHHGLVGLAHEHRPPLGLGVQRDRPHPPAVLEVELPHRADHAHRGRRRG